MKKIVVLSGKGGVGKSSIAASLAVIASKKKDIVCADCDVDASNLSLVLGASNHTEYKDLSTNEKAVFDKDKCISCRKCERECYFGAVGWKDDYPFLKEFSCEGCGYCSIICPAGAIKLEKVNNAKIGHSDTRYGFKVFSAQLNPGESGSGKVVSEVKKMAESRSHPDRCGNGKEIMIIDSAAGIGCPVIASVTGADNALIVTEPTPSGFSDMKRAFEVVRHFKIPCSIIINKYDLNQDHCSKIERFADDNGVNIIAKISFDKAFAMALSEMVPIVEYCDKYKKIFEDIRDKVM